MKKLLLPLIGALMPFYGEAQITLNKTDLEYQVGDTLIVHVITDTALIDYGQPGPNQVYDYTGLTGMAAQTVNNYVHENTSSDSVLSTADFYISDHPVAGQGTQHQYVVQNDSIFGNVGVQRFGNPDFNIYYQGISTSFEYPMTYGDSFSDSIDYYVDIITTGQGYFGLGHNSYTVDGYGTLMTDDTTVDAIRVSYNNYTNESFNGVTVESYTSQVIYFTPNNPTPAVTIIFIEQYVNGTFNGILEYLSLSDTSNYYKNVTSVSNLAQRTELSAFPNPAQETVHLNIEESGTLMIYEMTGRLVDQQEVKTGLETISVAHLPKGQYIFKVNSPTNVATKTIVKL